MTYTMKASHENIYIIDAKSLTLPYLNVAIWTSKDVDIYESFIMAWV